MRYSQVKPLLQNILRFARDRKGLAAVEFAMILPVMLIMFLGSIEVTNLLTADRRTQAVASTLADLVARDDVISTAEMDDIFAAATAVMSGFPAPAPQMTVTSIIDKNGASKVDWSRAKNAAEDAPGSTVSDLPAGLMMTGGSVIRVRVLLPYTLMTMGTTNYKQTAGGPGMAYDLGSAHTMTKTFYARPRLVQQIPAPS